MKEKLQDLRSLIDAHYEVICFENTGELAIKAPESYINPETILTALMFAQKNGCEASMTTAYHGEGEADTLMLNIRQTKQTQIKITNLTFGEAIKALKLGLKVTRSGWNGKRMFLWLKEATVIQSKWCKDPLLKGIVDENGGEIEALGTVCMVTADGKILTGWLASQADMLAEDWIVL